MVVSRTAARAHLESPDGSSQPGTPAPRRRPPEARQEALGLLGRPEFPSGYQSRTSRSETFGSAGSAFRADWVSRMKCLLRRDAQFGVQNALGPVDYCAGFQARAQVADHAAGTARNSEASRTAVPPCAANSNAMSCAAPRNTSGSALRRAPRHSPAAGWSRRGRTRQSWKLLRARRLAESWPATFGCGVIDPPRLLWRKVSTTGPSSLSNWARCSSSSRWSDAAKVRPSSAGDRHRRGGTARAPVRSPAGVQPVQHVVRELIVRQQLSDLGGGYRRTLALPRRWPRSSGPQSCACGTPPCMGYLRPEGPSVSKSAFLCLDAFQRAKAG